MTFSSGYRYPLIRPQAHSQLFQATLKPENGPGDKATHLSQASFINNIPYKHAHHSWVTF